MFSISLPMGTLSYFLSPIGTLNPFSFTRMDPTGQTSMAFWASSSVSCFPSFGSTTTSTLAASFAGRQICFLPFSSRDGPDTSFAKNTAVMFLYYLGMGGINLSDWETGKESGEPSF